MSPHLKSTIRQLSLCKVGNHRNVKQTFVIVNNSLGQLSRILEQDIPSLEKAEAAMNKHMAKNPSDSIVILAVTQSVTVVRKIV